MMCLSSSWTISCGVMLDIGRTLHTKADHPAGCLVPSRLRDEQLFQDLDDDVLVRVDAKISGDREALAYDRFGVERGILEQRSRRRLSVGSARPDRDQPVLWFQDVARAGDHERTLAVGDGEHRLEPPQDAIGPPVFCKLHRRSHQVALMLFELGLEALEQGEGVGRPAGEARKDAIVVEAPDLARTCLDDDVPERDLPVSSESDLPITTDREDGGA